MTRGRGLSCRPLSFPSPTSDRQRSGTQKSQTRIRENTRQGPRRPCFPLSDSGLHGSTSEKVVVPDANKLPINAEAVNSVTRGLVGDTSFAVLPENTPRMTFILTLSAQSVSDVAFVQLHIVIADLYLSLLLLSCSSSPLGRISSRPLPSADMPHSCLAGMSMKKQSFSSSFHSACSITNSSFHGKRTPLNISYQLRWVLHSITNSELDNPKPMIILGRSL